MSATREYVTKPKCISAQSRSAYMYMYLQCGDIPVLPRAKMANVETTVRQSASFATKQIKFERLNDIDDDVLRYSVILRYFFHVVSYVVERWYHPTLNVL